MVERAKGEGSVEGAFLVAVVVGEGLEIGAAMAVAVWRFCLEQAWCRGS